MTDVWRQRLILTVEGGENLAPITATKNSKAFFLLFDTKCALLNLTASVFNQLASYSLHEAGDVHIKHRRL